MYFLVFMPRFNFSLKIMIQDGFLEILALVQNCVADFYVLKCLCSVFNISVHINYGLIFQFFVEYRIHIVYTYHLNIYFIIQNFSDWLLLIVDQYVYLNVYLYYHIDYYVLITFTRLSYFFYF